MATSMLQLVTSSGRLYVPFVLTFTGIRLATIYKILTIEGKKDFSIISFGKFRALNKYKGSLILLVEFYLDESTREDIDFSMVQEGVTKAIKNELQNKKRIYKYQESRQPNKIFAEHEIDVITCTIEDVKVECVPIWLNSGE